jgi:hypothetical protein
VPLHHITRYLGLCHYVITTSTPGIRGCAVTLLPIRSSATASTPIGSAGIQEYTRSFGYSEGKLSNQRGIYLNIHLRLRASDTSHAIWVAVDPRSTETLGSRLTKRFDILWSHNGFYHRHQHYTSSTSTTSG